VQDITQQGITVEGKESDMASFFEWFGSEDPIPSGMQDDVRDACAVVPTLTLALP